MVPLSERPAEAADRAVPGPGEGDLIMGAACRSAIGTLVERATRFVMPRHLPDGHAAAQVHAALVAKIRQLPAQLRRSPAWDRGTQLAERVRFTLDSGARVYFARSAQPLAARVE
jgi:transposase, IS30 family